MNFSWIPSNITLTAGISILLIIFYVIIGLALYALFSFGLFTMANKRAEEYPWLAFIPLANIYLLGKMIGPFKIVNYNVTATEILLPIAVLLYFILSPLTIIGGILAAACLVFVLYALHKFYEDIAPDKSLFFTILSAVLPAISVPVIFFLNKDN